MFSRVFGFVLVAGAAFAQPRPVPAAAPVPKPAPATAQSGERIVAVVNGDVITTGDVASRAKLFALTTGLPVTPEIIARLRPQIAKQLVDERLRLQEVQRRKIVVSDQEIATAINEIEQRNSMAKGALNGSLGNAGVGLRTLIDQVRVQLGWTRVLRQELGTRAEISDADIADQVKVFEASAGQPEYRVGEIFLPVDEPGKQGDTLRFADTIIAQLRRGAPFPVMAAQFSQSQTALQGGDLGWVRSAQLDPPVAAIVSQMPDGAVSNPVAVAGGVTIVQMRGKRQLGRDQSTVVDLRQAFIPFTGALNPQAPTDQQRKAVEQAKALGSIRSCPEMEAANTRLGNARPSNPGEIRLEQLGSAPLRALVAGLQPGTASKPVISNEGVAVIILCSRENKTTAAPSKEEISARLLNERVELVARQLQRDLRRRATLEERSVT